MHQILWLLYIAITWYKKSTSLPKLEIYMMQKKILNVKQLFKIPIVVVYYLSLFGRVSAV